MKNRIVIGTMAVVFLLIMGTLLPGQVYAGVDVNISIPLFGLFAPGPPVVYAPAPPAYYAPAPVPGAMFYGGFWYRPSNGNWFVSAQAGGPWSMISVEYVPYAVISGPVMMHRIPERSYGYGGIGVGVTPWYRYGGHGGRGHHHGD